MTATAACRISRPKAPWYTKKLVASALGFAIGSSLFAAAAYADHAKLSLAKTRFFSPEESLLVSALHSWESGNASLASTTLDSLNLLAPKFGIAKGLQQAIRSQPVPAEADVYTALLAQPLNEATKTEFEQRWNYFQNPAPAGHVPAGLLRMAPSQRYALAVDLSLNRIYLFENQDNQAKLIADLYAGIGSKGFGKQVQGDKKTPVGMYFVTSQLSDNELDELYGIGAFPVNYPNALDRLRERTGNGIWIHGVPRKTWTRAPLSSRGCVTVANRDFQRLMGKVKPTNTPVLLSPGLNWVKAEQQAAEHDTLLKAISRWAQDWESLNTGKYLQHYSENFLGQGMNLAQWKEHKYRVNERKEWIKLGLGDISLYKDPAEDVVVATFLQEYQSNNFSSSNYKRQYWQQQEDGSWKILLENGV